MNIPLNGRIAIIDNEIKQALPLIKVFSKNQIPYVFYKGDDLEFLPDENSRYNDIRILFLDINLLNGKTPSNKEVKSTLYSVLKRVISETNFPYSLIYWSRQENEYSNVVEELFDNELQDRKPINLIPFVKSNFFPNFGEEEVSNDIDLIDEICRIIESTEAYSLLLEWENHIHLSADLTLQELFSSYHKFKDWSNNANYIVTKLAKAYLEKHLAEASSDDLVNASLQTLTILFRDYLESALRNREINSQPRFDFDKKSIESDIKQISGKLNLTSQVSNNKEPGCVLLYPAESKIKIEKIIDFPKLKQKCKDSLLKENPEIDDNKIEKKSKSGAFRMSAELELKIKEHSLSISVVVTPVCDYAQNNNVYDRIVQGLLIPKSEDIYIINNDALFIVPFDIIYDSREHLLVLDFRYFITTELTENTTTLFRIRQELLSEIQSKLSRHINRQGILLIDER